MVHTHTLQDGQQPAPIMGASLCTIKTAAAAQQRLPSATHWDGKSSQLQQTWRAMASEPGAQQSTACRLPDPIGQRRGAACLGGKATLTAAETQQPMRTQPTAWAQERGEPSYASPARALRSCAVRREGPSNLRYDLTTASKKQGQTHCQLCMLRQSCPTHARLLWLACSTW